MSELANNKSIRKEVNDLGETLGIKPEGKNNQQKIRSIGEKASDGTYATKEYVNTLMSGALKRQIVETLPTEDIDTNTIYMVLDDTASSGNVYNEYLYIENAWELIGTTSVDIPKKYKHSIKLSGSCEVYFVIETASNEVINTTDKLTQLIITYGNKIQVAPPMYALYGINGWATTNASIPVTFTVTNILNIAGSSTQLQGYKASDGTACNLAVTGAITVTDYVQEV